MVVENGDESHGTIRYKNHQQKQIWAKVQAKKITSMTEGHISYIKAFSKPGAKWRSVGHEQMGFYSKVAPKSAVASRVT